MLESISTKIFADGADLDRILQLAEDPRIEGFTTNPTLMWKAGLTDYSEFARSLLERITDKPISFEVFADDAERDPPAGARDRDVGTQRLREGSRSRPRRASRWRRSCASCPRTGSRST